VSNEAPTDALRLVPVKATPQQLETAAFNLSAEIGAEEAMKLGPHIERAYELLVAAAPASPLPEGGGDTDWQDKAEGLEADLRQAVLVAWKRGAEEWCRFNYPQWVEWLEACSAPAAPTGAK